MEIREFRLFAQAFKYFIALYDVYYRHYEILHRSDRTLFSPRQEMQFLFIFVGMAQSAFRSTRGYISPVGFVSIVA